MEPHFQARQAGLVEIIMLALETFNKILQNNE